MHRNRDGEMQVMGKENYEIQRMGNLNETKTMFLLSTLPHPQENNVRKVGIPLMYQFLFVRNHSFIRISDTLFNLEGIFSDFH